MDGLFTSASSQILAKPSDRGHTSWSVCYRQGLAKHFMSNTLEISAAVWSPNQRQPWFLEVCFCFCWSATATAASLCHVHWPYIMHFTNRCLHSFVISLQAERITAKERIHSSDQPKAGIAFTQIQFVWFCHFSSNKLLGMRSNRIHHFPITSSRLHITFVKIHPSAGQNTTPGRSQRNPNTPADRFLSQPSLCTEPYTTLNHLPIRVWGAT